MKNKSCKICGIEKNIENTNIRTDTKKQRFKTLCKICELEYWRTFRENNREKLKEQAKKYYKSGGKLNKKLNKLSLDMKSPNYNLKLTNKFWQDFNDKEMSIFLKLLFSYFRNKGFPKTTMTINEQYTEIEKFNKVKATKKILVNNEIKIDRYYLTNIHYSYFNMMEMRNKHKSPIEAFNDDKILKKIIYYRVCVNKWATGISDKYLLKDLKSGINCKTFSNFRPTAAYAIYDKYCPENATVWDMSGGWGGRYLGALLCEKVTKYITTEPSVETFAGLQNMSQSLTRLGFSSDILNLGSECYTPSEDSLDLCFTSPPYFDCEKYSDEPTQSYIKFPSKKEWLHGFLEKTIDNCYLGLKPGGYFLLNIANVKTYPELVEDFQSLMKTKNFEYIETINYLLPSRAGGQKFENIYVYKKTS